MKKWEIVIDKGAITCNICHRHENMNIAKIRYYTQDYRSNKREGKVCKNLQKHPHEIWICDGCLQDFKMEWWGTTNDRFRIWDGLQEI